MQSKIKYRKMATATRRAANRNYTKFVRSWTKTYPNDSQEALDEILEMFKQDRADLRKFAKFVNQGQITRAFKMIDRMDTAVYEQIPLSVYNYVNKSFYRDFNE